MEKNIKDYIPYYTGATLVYGSGKYVIKGFHYTESHADKLTVFVLNEDGDEDALPIDENSRIVLRPLSDMTDDEESELRNIWSDEYETGNNYTSIIADAAQIKWLLSKHFDLFGLIEAGLAIDATKQNTNL
jgi:hypothetical protein